MLRRNQSRIQSLTRTRIPALALACAEGGGGLQRNLTSWEGLILWPGCLSACSYPYDPYASSATATLVDIPRGKGRQRTASKSWKSSLNLFLSNFAPPAVSKLNADAIVVFKVDDVLLRIAFDNNKNLTVLNFLNFQMERPSPSLA